MTRPRDRLHSVCSTRKKRGADGVENELLRSMGFERRKLIFHVWIDFTHLAQR
jgi:hypothetical protein